MNHTTDVGGTFVDGGALVILAICVQNEKSLIYQN